LTRGPSFRTAEGNSNCPVINSAFNDSAPAFSWDGQTLIFWSNRAGGLGFNDLYVITREKRTGQQ
jgi:Tol biopolymer transport system component